MVERTRPATPVARAPLAADTTSPRVAPPVVPVPSRQAQERQRVPPPLAARREEFAAADIQLGQPDVGRPLAPQNFVEAVETRPASVASPPVLSPPAPLPRPTPAARSRSAPLLAFHEASVVRPLTRAAPLSEAIIAGRPMAARDQGPFIHVTIERLDVRTAPHARTAAAPAKPRPQPALSLSDYLRDGSGGGRR
jgi:hypothetical protein